MEESRRMTVRMRIIDTARGVHMDGAGNIDKDVLMDIDRGYG